jgi:PmbA protein
LTLAEARAAAPPAPEELMELATRVAGWAGPGEEVEAYVAHGRDTSVRVFGGEVESLSSAESAGIGIRVVAGGKQGFAYAGSLAEGIVADTLQEARDNARFATEDEHLGLARPDGVEPVALDLWREELVHFPTAEKIRLALDLDRRVRAADRRIRQVPAAEWGDSSVAVAIASSTGISARFRRSACYLSAEAIAGAGDSSQTGVGWSVGRAPGDLDPDRAASDAAERATRLLGAVKPRSARVTAVLEPRVAATVLAIVAGTLDGEAVQKGRSPFAERVGEQVAAAGFTLVDDPTDPDAYGAAAFDAEGLATRRNVLIDDGVLRMFLYNTYSGRRAGRASTGSAVRAGFRGVPGTGARAVTLAPGSLTPEQIYAEVGDGLLVQSVTGVHSGVNPVSGDFSVGAEGRLIAGGEPAAPVREFTIASTLQRMLSGVVAVGSDLERLPSSAAGLTLAVADVSMSGR